MRTFIMVIHGNLFEVRIFLPQYHEECCNLNKIQIKTIVNGEPFGSMRI